VTFDDSCSNYPTITSNQSDIHINGCIYC
jgi:hypothetical protein